jgi:hypothetical protein
MFVLLRTDLNHEDTTIDVDVLGIYKKKEAVEKQIKEDAEYYYNLEDEHVLDWSEFNGGSVADGVVIVKTRLGEFPVGKYIVEIHDPQ